MTRRNLAHPDTFVQKSRGPRFVRTVGYSKTRAKDPSDLNAPENRRVEVVNLAPQTQGSR
jgi:hypothetical protein